MNKYKTQNTPDKFFYSTKNIILRELGVGNTIFDIGCNDGYFGKFDKDNTYYGLDFSKKVLVEAEKYYKEVFFCDLNNLKKLPWNVKFDRIIFADVLEHVINPETVLSFFVANYLKEDGIVIISLPNIANWQVRLNLLFGKFNYSDTGILDRTHLHLYTKKTALSLIENSGLGVLYKKYSSNRFGFIIDKISLLGGLLGFNLIFVCQKEY